MGFEMALEQTDVPHLLRLGLSAEELRGALRGGEVVRVLGRGGGGAWDGAVAAAAQVLRVGCT
jgi:hypothetical protein